MVYFDGIDNIKDLKKEYVRLIKENYPVFECDSNDSSDREDVIINCAANLCKCMGMEEEYLALSNGFSRILTEEELNESCEQAKRIKSIFTGIVKELNSLPIYRRYFKKTSSTSYPNDDCIVSEENCRNGSYILKFNRDSAIDLYGFCVNRLHLSFDDIEFIYNSCGKNAEKFKRVIWFLLDSGVSVWDLRLNLCSDNPIPFFDDSIIEDGLPDYDSSLVLNDEVTSRETRNAWHSFVAKQSVSFNKRISKRLQEEAKVAVKN